MRYKKYGVMGITKTESFSKKNVQLAQRLKALGHPARLSIIEFILKNEDCICAKIVEHLTLSQATISQHLNELKATQLVKMYKKNHLICYKVNEKIMKELETFFNSIAFESSVN